MKNKNEINLLFAATPNFLKYATVTALSVLQNIPEEKNHKINLHFLYADIIEPLNQEEKNDIFERAEFTFKKFNIGFYSYDVSEHMEIFKGQSIGLWGEKISYTHYMYLLAPIILKNIDKVIYLDCDMCINSDLSYIFEIDMQDKLIAMGAPRGFEEMGDDVCNSGFSILNLKQWREENTLDSLLKFGKTISNDRFCDQYLLHNYFTKNNPDRLLLLDYRYNIFPQMFPKLKLEDIFIIHYTGIVHTRPWDDLSGVQRASFLWWYYAKQTAFYEVFINDFYTQIFNIFEQKFTAQNEQNLEILNKIVDLNKEIAKLQHKPTFLQKVFSVRNSLDKLHKEIIILGIKIKFKRKNRSK